MFMMIREITGWALLLFGLFLIWQMLAFVAGPERKILEAVALSIPATIVFRSGVGFLRLTTAAKIAGGIKRSS